jgi:hypothetical protein
LLSIWGALNKFNELMVSENTFPGIKLLFNSLLMIMVCSINTNLKGKVIEPKNLTNPRPSI